MSRADKLDLIYKHTHANFKGVASASTTPCWPDEMIGRRTVLTFREGAPMIVLLESLTDYDIDQRLQYAEARECA